MRDEVVHAFKPSVDGNTQVVAVTGGSATSMAVTVPHGGSPEYPGVARIISALANGISAVRRTTGTQATGPAATATTADIPIPPANVICYIELDQGTTFLSILAPTTGSLFITVGTGGGTP